MKRFFTFIICLCGLLNMHAASVNVSSSDSLSIDLRYHKIDPKEGGTPIQRTPAESISILANGHELSFAQFADDCTLLIADPTTNIVVYSQAIATDEDKTTIPANITGSYIICFVFDDHMYWGYILL